MSARTRAAAGAAALAIAALLASHLVPGFDRGRGAGAAPHGGDAASRAATGRGAGRDVVAADAPGAAAALALWQRFAMNGLVAPLLDDDAEPPRWIVPTLVAPCGESARVWVDGEPLAAGSALPRAPRFALRFQLLDCLPFGLESIGLSGEVVMAIERHDDRLDALVLPNRLVVVGADGRRIETSAPFDASLRLRIDPDVAFPSRQSGLQRYRPAAECLGRPRSAGATQAERTTTCASSAMRVSHRRTPARGAGS